MNLKATVLKFVGIIKNFGFKNENQKRKDENESEVFHGYEQLL